MKKALVTGAAGFTGISLVKALLCHEYEVYAIVRPKSENNRLIEKVEHLHILEIDLLKPYALSDFITCNLEVAFHLACVGERYDFDVQRKNIDLTLKLMDELHTVGCKRVICTGSQAEYGATNDFLSENRMPNPFCPYGASKVATCYLSRNKANTIGMEWIWARVFSLYGDNEPRNRMLPKLIDTLKRGDKMVLSSCRQNWDYLNVRDAAEALIALAEKGRDGEIYNVAKGDYRELKEYIEMVKEYLGGNGKVEYGDDAEPFVSLQSDISKIQADTGWSPKIDFVEGLNSLG